MSLRRLRGLVWWHARFAWCAFLQRDFEDVRVQALVDEHFVRFYRTGK